MACLHARRDGYNRELEKNITRWLFKHDEIQRYLGPDLKDIYPLNCVPDM